MHFVVEMEEIIELSVTVLKIQGVHIKILENYSFGKIEFIQGLVTNLK